MFPNTLSANSQTISPPHPGVSLQATAPALFIPIRCSDWQEHMMMMDLARREESRDDGLGEYENMLLCVDVYTIFEIVMMGMSKHVDMAGVC